MSTRATKSSTPQFPNRLREWRKHRGLSLEKLGEAVGYSANTVSKHETGGYEVTVAQLDVYAEALGIKAEMLLQTGSTLSPQIRALVDLAIALPPDQLDLYVRQGLAFKESHIPYITPSDEHSRRPKMKKKA